MENDEKSERRAPHDLQGVTRAGVLQSGRALCNVQSARRHNPI